MIWIRIDKAGRKVTLAHNVEKTKEKKPKTKKDRQPNDSLFEVLRKLRLKIAKDEGVPPYIVFNDATLKEMVAHKPTYDEAFLDVDGVGKAKLEKYGDLFMNEILNFEKEGKQKKANTYQETWELYQKGLSVEEIALARKLNETTIFSHLSKLYLDGKDIQLEKYLEKGVLERVRKVHVEIQDVKVLKPYFEYLKEEVSYGQIRIALTIIGAE